MILLLRILLKMLPWLIVVALLSWMLLAEKLSFDVVQGKEETYQNTLLTKVEQLGKLELVKYNFQEVTEVKKLADYVDLKFFKYKLLPDAKAVLISQGSAVGCIDLTLIKKEDITQLRDTVYVTLPAPELCYFKIDLEKSRIYDLEISGIPREEQKAFMEELYQAAESEIRNSALQMGILEQTRQNAQTILTPVFQDISGKVVILKFDLDMPSGPPM